MANEKSAKKQSFAVKVVAAVLAVAVVTTGAIIFKNESDKNRLIVTAFAEAEKFNSEAEGDRMFALTANRTAAIESADKQIADQARRVKEKEEQDKKPVYVPRVSGVFDPTVYGDPRADRLSYWKSVNSDTIGYLYIPGTNISHAVVQNKYDVNYYTARGYDKNYSYYGVLWTNPDTSSTGLSPNTVIYGHNWKNYSAAPQILNPYHQMFDQLTSYHYADMGRTYPYIYYTTASGTYTFKIFATFYTDLGFDYINTYGDVGSIAAEAKRRSRNYFDVDVNGSDKIITLSTCTRAYGATNRQRFVVMGRLLRPGEVIGPVSVSYNPNHQRPDVWNN